MWALVAKYSKNLVFDGLLYDTVMVLVYTLSISFLTGDQLNWSWYNWIGVCVVVVGFILMKI